MGNPLPKEIELLRTPLEEMCVSHVQKLGWLEIAEGDNGILHVSWEAMGCTFTLNQFQMVVA
jgi:hypothetical protein